MADGFRQARPEAQATSSTRVSRCAVASLVLGILACPFSLLASVPGLIFGIVGLRRIARSERVSEVPRLSGRSIAITGIILSGLATVAFPVMVAILLPAVQAARQAALNIVAMNNLKQVSLALQNAEMKGRAFPSVIVNEDGTPLLSWRVAILPFLGDEAAALFSEFHLDEPWDSEHNRTLIARMPAVYVAAGTEPVQGLTQVVQPVGDGEAFGEFDAKVGLGDGVKSTALGVRASALSDGLSKTVLAVSIPGLQVPWTKPADLSGDPVKLLQAARESGVRGFAVAMGDGSAMVLQADTPPRTVKAMFSRAGDDGP